MSELHETVDRRRSARIPVEGIAFLFRDRHLVGRYGLANLSMVGCALCDGPPCAVGDIFALMLRVRGDDAGPLQIPARVVRHNDASPCELGCEFLSTPPATEGRLHKLVHASERAPESAPGRVLLAVGDSAVRQRLASALRGLGQWPLEAPTPLAAVWELESATPYIHTALVARVLGRSDGRDLLKLLFQRHRSVRRVLLSDDLRPAAHADAVLSSSCDAAALHEVLPPPSRRYPPRRLRATA